LSYALIPEGYTLKKVTKAQKDAVNDLKRHEDIKTVLNNPEIIKQIIITGFAYLAVKEGKEALTDLKNLGVSITKDVEDAYTKKRTVKAGDFIAPVGVSFEDLINEGLKRFGLG
jgi:hypothetical protein